MIALHTKGKESENRAKALQTKRMQDAIDFVKKINELRGAEQKQFRIEVSEWAGEQTKTVATLRQQLDESIEEIRRQKEALVAQKETSQLLGTSLRQLQGEAEQRALLDATPLSPSTEDAISQRGDFIVAPTTKKQPVHIIPRTDPTTGVTTYAAIRTQAQLPQVFHSRSQPGPSAAPKTPPQLRPSALPPLPPTPPPGGRAGRGGQPPPPAGGAGGAPHSSPGHSSNHSHPRTPQPPRLPQLPVPAPAPVPAQGLVIM